MGESPGSNTSAYGAGPRPPSASAVQAVEVGRQGQDVTRRFPQVPVQQTQQAGPLRRILQFGAGRIEVVGQAVFLPEIIQDVFVGGPRQGGIQEEPPRDGLRQGFRLAHAEAPGALFAGQQARVVPDRLSVRAPVYRQGPARQRLAGIPFSLAMMREAAGGETRHYPPHQPFGHMRLRVPKASVFHSGASVSSTGDEGRFAPWVRNSPRSRHILVDTVAHIHQRMPFLVGDGRGHARLFLQARHLHGMA